MYSVTLYTVSNALLYITWNVKRPFIHCTEDQTPSYSIPNYSVSIMKMIVSCASLWICLHVNHAVDPDKNHCVCRYVRHEVDPIRRVNVCGH